MAVCGPVTVAHHFDLDSTWMGSDWLSLINWLVMPSPVVVLLTIHKTLCHGDILSFNKLSEAALP